MSRFFVPADSPEDWKHLLAEPNRHWRTGYSAKSLAYCWQQANDFPRSVKEVFRKSEIPCFHNVRLLLAFPEYKVQLPGGRRASQNDIFVLAKAGDELFSIMVEGKVAEPFGETVAEWKSNYSIGKQRRLSYLCGLLHVDAGEVPDVRYQLMHRTASAIIEARKFNAPGAVMLVHSFSPDNEGFDDYHRFLLLFGAEGRIDSVVSAGNLDGTDLYFAWVNEKLLPDPGTP
jgi:hypothetical protein